MDIKLFQECLLATYLEKPEKAVLKWISFYEKETGNTIDQKRYFENEPQKYFMDIMNQIQDYGNNHNPLGEELKRIKKLL